VARPLKVGSLTSSACDLVQTRARRPVWLHKIVFGWLR
jgi:hypothetical protein